MNESKVTTIYWRCDECLEHLPTKDMVNDYLCEDCEDYTRGIVLDDDYDYKNDIPF